jgi:NADPH:quinone reductase-like Zn-dependent oxidoreductase
VKRVVVRAAGGWDRLEVVEERDPAPGPGEVLVRTDAAGVNFADVVVRMGLYESAKKYVGWPITPGFEVAGSVEAVGSGVMDVSPGARVLAVTRFGGYATHVVVPRDQVFAVPRALSQSEAAALPVVYLTAWWALVVLAAAEHGSRILVHSAAGGVGAALLQLARSRGCFSVGVVGRAAKVDFARRMGASVVIDKSSEDLWRAASRHAPDGYDAVFDSNGPSTLRESYLHLAAPGRLVVYGFASMLPRGGGARGRPSWPKLAIEWLKTPRFDPLAMTNENRSVMGFNLSYLFERKDRFVGAMRELLAQVERAEVAPLPVTEFPLSEVAAAHRAIESGETTGKLVLVTR